MKSNPQRRGRPAAARRGAAAADIPVAQRATPRLPMANPWPRRVGTVGGALLLVMVSLALVFPQPLRRWLAQPPVPGLAARPGLDGRLLGHFPYGQAPAVQLVEIGAGQRLHRDAARELLAMLEAARADGVNLVVLSAFRSRDDQQALFFDVKAQRNQSARERARVSAPPGYSEHSTGYAVDLGDAAAPVTNLAESFDGTAAFAWLKTNAHRHHFILSFPPNNAQGVSYEPWHWRFEGTAEALRLFEPAERFSAR
ncbi:MAG: D-alanyl-D-alanine carboxypeptidase family protein [Cyanobacteriota bacterium]